MTSRLPWMNCESIQVRLSTLKYLPQHMVLLSGNPLNMSASQVNSDTLCPSDQTRPALRAGSLMGRCGGSWCWCSLSPHRPAMRLAVMDAVGILIFLYSSSTRASTSYRACQHEQGLRCDQHDQCLVCDKATGTSWMLCKHASTCKHTLLCATMAAAFTDAVSSVSPSCKSVNRCKCTAQCK